MSNIKIPDGVGAAEAKLRRRYCAELKEAAAGQPAEIYRHMTVKARRIMTAMPAREFIEKRKSLRQMAAEMGAIPGNLTARLDEENIYPPGLIDAVDRRLTSALPCIAGDAVFNAAVEEAADELAGPFHG